MRRHACLHIGRTRHAAALDVFSAFGNNLLDPKVGKRYRDTILAQGGQKHPAQLVKDFLGREPNSEAFFAEITGRR